MSRGVVQWRSSLRLGRQAGFHRSRLAQLTHGVVGSVDLGPAVEVVAGEDHVCRAEGRLDGYDGFELDGRG